MKTKLIIFLILNLQIVPVISFGQLLYTENDTIQLDQDSVVLQVDSYRGQIQWQFSSNNVDWNDLSGEESDKLEFAIFGGQGFYKASITEGTCAPVYSEMAQLVYEAPVVVTDSATGVTFNSANLNGEVTSNGGTDVTSRGFYWSKSNADPDAGDNVENIGGGIGKFSVSLGLLETNTTYYVRAFATNSAGISLGEVFSFTTPTSVEKPVVSTFIASGVSFDSATLNGEVASDGGAAVTSRGFYWSKTNNNPGSSDNVETAGNGTGIFSASLTGLESNTTYYVRTFATNSEGTSVGEVVSFTTSQSVNMPTLTTNAATSVNSNSATLNGEVTSDGGATVTSRGFYWSKTNNNPGSSDNVETAGNGTGIFSTSLTGLESNTTYYLRTFATNSKGTSVGEVISFKTISGDLPKDPGWIP